MSEAQAQNDLTREAARALREGDGWFPEADDKLNNASRRLVAAVAAEHGEAWLARLNGYREADWRPLWKWDGELVCNFAADVVLPRFDAECERLILERAAAEYTGTRADAERVCRIFAAIEAAGGRLLHWS